MKTLFLAFFLVAFFFSSSHAEIEARFPGVQPIAVNGAADPGPTGIEDKRVIDAFTFDTVPPLTILIPTSGAPPALTATTFDVDSTILGGERDIILTATQGVEGVLFSAGASGTTFNLATSVDSFGLVTLQYDGVDRSANLQSSPGLGGIDLTADGAFGFRVFARTDVDTQFSIRVVDSDGVSSKLTSSAEGGFESQSYYLTFEAFGFSVDFTRVVSIELTIQALENVDFVVETFVTYGDIEVVQIEDCITGVILPCDVDYYRLVTFTDVQIGDYLAVSFAESPSDASVAASGKFYIISSTYEDLQEELASNENIKDTFGELPGPLNYEYSCSGDCRIEIVAPQLKNLTYYLAVSGGGDGNLAYQICLNYRSVTIFNLVDGLPKTVFLDQRPTTPPEDSILHYRFYTIDVPHENYVEGTFLVVNISRAEPLPGVGLKLMYGALPELAVDTGVLGTDEVATSGVDVDHAIYDYCVDMTEPGRILYDRPISVDPRVPCQCFTEVLLFGNGPSFQLTCQLVVDPCQFRYGRWYLSVELPVRQQPSNPLDQTGNANYTIVATTIQPSITEMIRNVTFKAFVEREAYSHFRLNVTANTVNVGRSHLFVHLSNVRNGFVDLYVHRASTNEGANLAGGIESCVPANATCHTSDACNVIIEKCHFVPGIWYISVAISYDNVNKKYMVNDIDRLPLTFTLRANWIEDAAPKRLVAGVPTASFIGEALYDFYVITVPPTIDTWLFVELYAKANDTEVILSILNGELPGGDCYARPDYYCMTGDPTDARFNSGSPAFLKDDPAQRESCSFMIQTCELTAGSLFLSVYGHHKGYSQYGDHTFYQVPVHYTLWADFDSALAITSGVSYSETVFEKQYQHYYIRADQVAQGSSLSVEVTNIQHGAPQTIEAFVNFNYLAGNCPCYDHLYNCTGAVPCGSSASLDVVHDCCTIVVPASDFRPGVWYIAVLGVHEDLFSYTTPIGYTLTATVHEAPEFNPLLLGQIYQGEVPEWNTTLQYANFRLGAVPVPLADLVFKVTFVQNCDFMGKHNDKADSLTMFVNSGAPATQYLGGYRYKCVADGLSQSYCTIVVPHCEWTGDDWFVAIQGNYAAQFTGRFSLRAFTDEIRDYQLTSGVSHYDRVSEYRYKHFFIDVVAQEDEYYSIDLYTNNDQDSVSVYLRREERAGKAPCFGHSDVCTASSYCTWQLHACDIESGRYYISVYGNPGQFYDTSVEFTLTVTKNAVSTQLFDSDPFTGHLKQVGDVRHYRFAVSDSFRPGSFLSFQIDNVQHGAVTAFVQHGFLAGRCPCFVFEQSCNAQTLVVGDDDAVGWCEIRVPSCELESGDYFLSIWAVEAQTPAAAIFVTPIGYTLEVNLITPIITDPFVALGRDLSNTEPFQFIANRRYNHYRFTVGKEDFSNGYHFILEITSVRDGALFVYYNQLVPGGEEAGCHVSKLCTSGLGSGQECYWQLPYCMARPLASNQYHYITVEAIASLVQASYNLLIYKQDAPSIISNPTFTLDNGVPTTPVGAVISILHNKIHEPKGWTQFIRLSDVPARLDEGKGEMLELFFYKITNNPGQSMDFNVYLHPNKPAGAHTCCGTDPSTIGNCQGAPCSNTVDVTASVNGAVDVISHTCALGNGIGSDGNGNPLFGARCTIRVWPCEFNKYCAANTTDWFVSIVPLSATSPTSSGSGLQYSLQWRVRDIRRLASTAIGSLNLNSVINTYEYTDSFSVSTTSTEAPGFLSFYVDYVSRNDTRLSIQTRFAAGSGLVTIRGGEFASHTCNLYECSSNCDSTSRFVVSECRAHEYERYYITVQNTGSVNSQLSVQFRIVEIDFPEAITIAPRPSLEVPFVASATESVHSGVIGIEGENYDYYSLTVDDDDLDQFQTWVIDVNRPSSDVGSLSVFVKFGAAGGLDDAVEGCHGFQYSCDNVLAGSRCLLQIPSCRLTTGHWYISIFNPSFGFNSIPSSLPRYTLTTYISHAPTPVSLGVSVSPPANFDRAIIQHYAFDVQPEDIFDNGVAIDGFVSRYLRVQLDDVVGSNTLYVGYGSLAGLPSTLDCYQFAKSATCNGASCFVDFLPCLSGDAGLKTGTYFVAVYASGSYSLSARILTDDYTTISLTETIVGSGNRLGVTDHLYSYTPSQAELNGRGDGADNYRYLFEIDSDAEDNSLPDNEYLVFNFTSPNGAQNGAVTRFEVFRDSCSRFTCETVGPNSWCVVDAIEMAPCSSFGGLLYVRVENPSSVQFTVNLYHNQTVIQKLENHQTLTEIIFPYEYQEYLFNAESLGDASVFSVSICAICGEVEAFIRANGPAGPDTPNSGGICSIDSCSVSGSMDTTFDPENNCCTLFLDTCQYKESDYYIGVRGVSTDFPNVRNTHIYLPAKYEINVEQTNVNVTDIQFSSCPKVIQISHSYDDPPAQYAIDIESLQVGSQVKFSIRLPSSLVVTVPATLKVQLNHSLGYSDGCPLGTDEIFSCSTLTSCSLVVPYCKFAHFGGGARFYLLADAPRGSEIIVERHDPSIPVLTNDVTYSGSINHGVLAATNFYLPWTPNSQIYRFDLAPHSSDDEDDSDFFEKFYVEVQLSNIQHGTLSVVVNAGNSPFLPNTGCTGAGFLFVDTSSCSGVDDECFVEIHYSDLRNLYGGADRFIPKTFWLTVIGDQQTCELHAIKYDLIVKTNWVITYFPVNESVCNSVHAGSTNFHRLRPKSVETPQESILRIHIEDLDVGEELFVMVQDKHIATNLATVPFSELSTGSTEIDVDYICGYSDLYLSVTGLKAIGSDSSIDYRMTVEKTPVRVKDLFNNQVYHADDDDDDACPHKHDFYRFKTAPLNGHHPGAFLRVLVDSDFDTKVYVNKNSFAWEGCADSGTGSNSPATSGTTSVNVYDFCDFDDGSYFITVVSQGPYKIFTHVRDDAKNLTLGEVYRDQLEPGSYQMYILDVCKEWMQPDDRLVVEIADVQNSDVEGTIRHNANSGIDCALDRAISRFGGSSSGYNFLLVDSCELDHGHYYILIHALPLPAGSTNAEDATFRLFPYLVDYDIEPKEIFPNLAITDSVDLHRFDRIAQDALPSTQYYMLSPYKDGRGYYEQVSQAVVRLFDVSGGLLQLRVMRDHLAVPEFEYIGGETNGLIRPAASATEFNMRYGQYPLVETRILGDRTSAFQSGCDGCSDFCGTMTADDLDRYSTDSSIAVWVPSCYMVWSEFFVAVTADEQASPLVPISYSLEFEQTRDFILLQTDHHHVQSFTDNNWDYDFYYSISSEPSSMRWRVVVTEGDGVLVTVRNHRCPLQSTWSKQIWCDAAYFDRPWMCDIEIPTRAAHPGDNAYFVSVYGKNATYSIAFWRGRENCHSFTGSGRNEGLDFCAGLIPYGTWRWENYGNLDKESKCLFEQLYSHFRVQPCYTGVTPECNATLQAFACYESFKRCDEQGFSTGTCRGQCDLVAYECANNFETVDLEHYECTSSRYIDSHAGTCTGNSEYDFADDAFFLGDAVELLFKSSPSESESAASLSLLSGWVFVLSFLLSLL